MTCSRTDRRTILIVEDEPSLRDSLSMLMESAGYRVRVAGTGLDGIRAIEVASPPVDAVVLDIGLPDIGGEEVFAFIRRDHPALKVIVVTGYAYQPVAQDLSRQADGFLEKPFSFACLAGELDAVLAASRGP